MSREEIDLSPSQDKKDGSITTGGNASDIVDVRNAALERRVWKKMDWAIIPVVAMFYLLSFLDRANIGNAKVAGLQKDLKLTNKQYSIALTVTYVPYIAAELPSNLLLRAVGPNLMLPTMLTLWGVVTTSQGAVKSYHGLLACRFFLGLLEGGVFPGLVLYLSGFYTRRRLHVRISAFFSAASVSGAFSGILAFGIIKLDGKGGHPGWAWIFFLEGGFTIAFGLLSFFILPRTPKTARCLTTEESDYVMDQLHVDGALSKDESKDNFSWIEVGRAFVLPQMWFLAVAFFFSGTILYGLAFFTAPIIQSLGYTAARAQLFSVPPFAVAFFVTMITSYLSDRYNARGITIIFCSALCTIGFAMFLGSSNKHVRYGSLFFSISGVYCSAPALSTWSSNNSAPHTRRATAIAISFIMTNSGGILATWLLGSISPTPPYHTATVVLLVFSVSMGVASLLNLLYLVRMNKAKAVKRVELAETGSVEKEGLGDKSAMFEYNL